MVFRISISRICDYKHLNSLSGSLLALSLMSILVWSGIFGYLGPLQPKQVGAQDQQIAIQSYEDIKYKVIPKMVMFDLPSKQSIEVNRNLVQSDSFKQLIAQADSYLAKEPISVMKKKQTPSSGDKHDFLSLSPYYWPDPKKPDGLPYIYRDGERTPEVNSIPDERNMREMIRRVSILSVAYYLTDNILYASKASELLRVWFLNNDTHMNPNLQHSELIPGKNSGSHSGIIAGIYFPDLIDAIGLIRDSSAWTKHDQQGIEIWFEEYLEWLLNSDFGKDESKALNNHRTWFDVQVSSIALFLNKTEITRDVLKKYIDKLIGAKINSDGSQPFEIQRRTSLDYHIFNLLAFFNLAKIGDHIGIDIWDYKTREGSGLKNALYYLLPYALENKTWPYEQIKPIDKSKLLDLLCQATIHYNDSETFKQAYRSVDRVNAIEKIDNLIFGCTTA
jgi:hypothetical protein